MTGVTARDHVELRECCLQSGKLHSQNRPYTIQLVTYHVIHGVHLLHLIRYTFSALHIHIQSVTEKCGRILGTSSTYQNKKKCLDQHVPGNIAERIPSWPIQLFSIGVWAGFVGDLFGGPACFATSAYRQPLPRFPLTRSARATGRCTTVPRKW
jgi:hypothetical protein